MNDFFKKLVLDTARNMEAAYPARRAPTPVKIEQSKIAGGSAEVTILECWLCQGFGRDEGGHPCFNCAGKGRVATDPDFEV